MEGRSYIDPCYVLRSKVACSVVHDLLLQCTMEQRMRLEADCLIGDCRGNEYDLIVLPGGNAGTPPAWCL